MFKTVAVISISCMLILSACTGQEAASSQQNKTIPAQETLRDHDPYFVESEDIYSTIGPQSITRNLIQDKKGKLWFATWEGIMSYDGQQFTNHTNKDSLRRYHVFGVLENRRGNLWFATVGAGVYKYAGRTFTNITTKDGLANDRVVCLYQDNAGRIWIGTEGGASLYDGKAIRNFTTNEGLAHNEVNAIIEDKDGLFWMGTRGDACTYDGIEFKVLKNEEGERFSNVRAIIRDRNDRIWLGGNSGLWTYADGAFTKIAKGFIGYIYEDKSGNIWTGGPTSDPAKWELLRYNYLSLQHKAPKADQIRIQEGQVFGILEDHAGNIWFGHERGICKYRGKAFNCFDK